MVFAPPSSAAVKRIPLDPPDESAPAEVEPVDEVAERSPFALPAETHQIDADYLAQAGSLSGDEVSAERYRDALNAVLDLTCAELRLDPYDLTVDHTFAELGATPASMAPVITQINTRFTVELTPDELFATYTTPHKLATAVAIHTANVAEGTESTKAEGTESVSGSVEPTGVAAEAEDGTPSEAAAQSDDGAADAAGVRVEGGAAAGTVVRAEGGVAGESAARVEDGGAEAAASRIEDGAEDRAASQTVDGAEDRAGLKAEDGAAADEAVGEVDAGSVAEAGLQTPAQPAEQALSTAEVAGRTTNGPVTEADAAAEADAEAGAGSVAETVAAMEADAEVAAASVVGAGASGVVADAAVGGGARGEAGARDPRAALAVLGSGLAELAAKVDEAAAATSEAELPGSGMAALMSQQLRVAGQLVDGVTKLMREQLALLTPEVAEDIDTDVTSTEPVAPLVDAGDAASAANNPGDATFTADEPGDAGSTAGKPGEDTPAAGRTGEGASADEVGVSPESEPAAGESAVPATELSGDEAVAQSTELAGSEPAVASAVVGGDESVVPAADLSGDGAVAQSTELVGDEPAEVGGDEAVVAATEQAVEQSGEGTSAAGPGEGATTDEPAVASGDGAGGRVGRAVDEDAAEGEVWRRDFGYWSLALAGSEPLVLPSDRGRPAGEGAVASVKKELAEELGDAVFVFSRERKVSPLMTMLAAVGTVLGRFAAQDDVTIGSALIRPQGDTSTTIRRPLPLRIDLSGEPDLGELAQRVRDVTTGAFDHAGTDLALMQRDPLFQILVEFEDGDDELPDSIDLRLRLTHHGAGITCTADYRSGLFDQTTIDRLLAYLEAVLRRATTQPHLRLPELMLPIESDLETLRELEGDLEPTGPVGRARRDAVVAGELSGLHTLFEQQVARTPDAIALIQGKRELTYAELDRRSNAVAWQLTDLGVKPGQLVAVRVARGTELVVAVLAVLKSGAAYLPLDPGVPESRWAFMIQDASAVALVGDDAALADRLGLRLVPVAATDGDPRARQAPPVRAAADDVAYCIYTSGSTGNPKGVVVPHRGPVNLARHYLRTRRSLRTLQWTSFGFDVHVQEMFTTLASGAALVLIGEDDRYDPDAVIAALRDHRVERLFMAFSPLTALLATMRRLPELPALREIVAGGEAMVLTHKVRDFLEAHPECRLFNEYGPAEASIVTTIHAVDPAEDRPSIGRPVEGVVVRLLDEALRPVPVGAVGEIHLGGSAVAQGYIGRPEETERVFVPDPGHPGGRLYRSRDLGRWRVDGTLEYLGRADDQVKIRGHRVEPGETEHVLADQPGVVDAVVVACADPGGDTCLIGYVVLEDSDPAVLARLMLDLGKELPIYLVPADLIPIEELPLDDNGRLDRGLLPEPEWLKP